MSETLRILVVGATGGTGRATVAHLVADGHAVTAFSRRASSLAAQIYGVAAVDGDVTDPSAVDRAVAGQDVVIVTLGIAENPFRVRLLGPARTPRDVRSRGTANVIAAMRRHGVTRLVVQSSYGVGETRARLGVADRLFFDLILRPQIVDTEAQERAVRASGLDWVLAQPVHLTDAVASDDAAIDPFVSVRGETRRMKVARSSVARFLASAARTPDYVGATVAVSG